MICSAVAVATTLGQRKGKRNAIASSTGAVMSAARNAFVFMMFIPANKKKVCVG